jgi:hypothetical protein
MQNAMQCNAKKKKDKCPNPPINTSLPKLQAEGGLCDEGARNYLQEVYPQLKTNMTTLSSASTGAGRS